MACVWLSDSTSRRRFWQKLIGQAIWVPRALHPPKHQTVTVFDWDDTLLCTTWMRFYSFQGLLQTDKDIISEIGRTARQLLELALNLGHVFILTNALDGWVQQSAAKWIPELSSLLDQIPIISARTMYEGQFPSDPGKWKRLAIFEIQKRLPGELPIGNLLSLGDQDTDMEATHAFAKVFDTAIVKTIKFKELPKPDTLLRQHKLCLKEFRYIAEHAESLEVSLVRQEINDGYDFLEDQDQGA